MKRPHTLDLNDVIQHPGRRLSYDISLAPKAIQDVELHTPLTGELEAVSTGNALLLKGDFQAQIWVECSRCALRFAEPISFKAQDEFILEGTPAAHSHHSNAKVIDDEPYPLFEGNALLLDEFVHQHLVLNLPTKPLCQEACEGLCPHCGANLNEGKCECDTEELNPAFAELAHQWYTEEK